jgi:hypothetical protein
MRVSAVNYEISDNGSKYLTYLWKGRYYDWGTSNLSEEAKNTLDQNGLVYYEAPIYGGLNAMFTEDHPLFNMALLLYEFDHKPFKYKVTEYLVDLLEYEKQNIKI